MMGSRLTNTMFDTPSKRTATPQDRRFAERHQRSFVPLLSSVGAFGSPSTVVIAGSWLCPSLAGNVGRVSLACSPVGHVVFPFHSSCSNCTEKLINTQFANEQLHVELYTSKRPTQISAEKHTIK